MGSCAAPSAKGDDKFITTDYLQQCPSAQGRREAQRRCGPRPGPSATMPVHATAARAGWVPSSRVTSRPDPWSPCPPAR